MLELGERLRGEVAESQRASEKQRATVALLKEELKEVGVSDGWVESRCMQGGIPQIKEVGEYVWVGGRGALERLSVPPDQRYWAAAQQCRQHHQEMIERQGSRGFVRSMGKAMRQDVSGITPTCHTCMRQTHTSKSAAPLVSAYGA
jgi:hypothetical protein